MRIGHASISENGTVNGVAGDQTGNEVCIRSYYNKPWDVCIRPMDTTRAEWIAEFVETCCNNENIGYSQNDRNSLFYECDSEYFAKLPEFDTKVNCDCSSLVTCALIYAEFDKNKLFNGNCCTTRTLRSVCKDIGEFEFITNQNILSNPKHLCRGDILLKEGSHVVVFLDNPRIYAIIPDVKVDNITVEDWQNAVVKDGISTFPRYGVDNEWGNECECIASKIFITKYSPRKNLVSLIQRKLGIAIDGIFGNDTYNAVIEYQKANNLEVDGVVGIESFKCMLGVV